MTFRVLCLYSYLVYGTAVISFLGVNVAGWPLFMPHKQYIYHIQIVVN
jgi:hypothetical protein